MAVTFGDCFRQQADLVDRYENDKEGQARVIKTFGACWTNVAEALERRFLQRKHDDTLLREFEGMLT